MQAPEILGLEYPNSKKAWLPVQPLTADDEGEVLDFLAERALHTFALAGYLLNNGMTSPENRGTFYGYRNERAQLEGVALIGHHTFVEYRTRDAARALGQAAHKIEGPRPYLLLGEQERIDEFWHYYSNDDMKARQAVCEHLLVQRRVPQTGAGEPRLRLASRADLDLVVTAHARAAIEATGKDPMEGDRSSFVDRCVRRIDRERTWVLIEEGRLIFKAEVVTDTPDVMYVDSVWVDPQEREKRHALACFTELSRRLLQRTKCICGLVDERDERALELYRKAGCERAALYTAIFL